MTIEKTKQIKKLTEELFEHLLLKGKVVVTEDKESAVFNIQIETEESGFLIGYHGETLEAFQMILSLIVYKKLDEWLRLVVNVGDYRQKREEQLRKLALNVAQKVKFSKQAQAITNLSAGERRIVHLALAGDEQVMTESEGEGRDRKLVIKLKTSN